jgi:hypothetical protein
VLLASKAFQKAARAGESGKNMVVRRGIEMVGASNASTSFTGHFHAGEDGFRS